jgi:hypothetical protein
VVEDKRLILSRELHRRTKHLYKTEHFALERDEKDLKMNLPLLCEMVSRYSDWKHQATGFIEWADTAEVAPRLA